MLLGRITDDAKKVHVFSSNVGELNASGTTISQLLSALMVCSNAKYNTCGVCSGHLMGSGYQKVFQIPAQKFGTSWVNFEVTQIV